MCSNRKCLGSLFLDMLANNYCRYGLNTERLYSGHFRLPESNHPVCCNIISGHFYFTLNESEGKSLGGYIKSLGEKPSGQRLPKDSKNLSY